MIMYSLEHILTFVKRLPQNVLFSLFGDLVILLQVNIGFRYECWGIPLTD
jgi:hypothetical protein